MITLQIQDQKDKLMKYYQIGVEAI